MAGLQGLGGRAWSQRRGDRVPSAVQPATFSPSAAQGTKRERGRAGGGQWAAMQRQRRGRARAARGCGCGTPVRSWREADPAAQPRDTAEQGLARPRERFRWSCPSPSLGLCFLLTCAAA